MSSQNSGQDLFPALETLSRLIAPHVKSVIFLALILNHFPLLPDLYTLLTSQTSAPLILIAALYFGGVWALPSGDGENNNNTSWASFLGPFFALQTVSNRIGTYFKIGSLISLGYYLPIYYSIPFPFPTWVRFLFMTIVVAVCTVLYLFAPVTKIYGPLRFCYLEHAQTYWVLLNWWSLTAVFIFFSPTLLPFFGFGLVGVSVGTWVYIYYAYQEQLRTISNQVTQEISRAKVSAAAAQQYGVSARQYEQEMLTAAAAARRDAVLANTVRLSDFFDVASRAWSALGETTAPAEDAIIKAHRLVDAASACEEAEKPDSQKKGDAQTERLARYLRQTAESAQERAREAVALLRAAQSAVRASENATRQDAVARRNAEYSAEHAAGTAKTISEKIAGIPDAELAAAKGAEDVARLGEQANAAALNGELKTARELIESAKTAADGVETSTQTVRDGLESVQKSLQQWLQSSRKGM
ncbi:uncharacterized protein NECHADRAFT_87802 [Fusarium vanettenii 77-13-4]|uniref:Uncharacterized protein n=1 Tax=Fusarium vanettenii (strain ATCC MYA-4622 / CBS 123669 / FGSC 9596 / NRRL 45880 / 77-13-4) TaxID=660122 RepID=C7Z326_FUSV7|nr:uncharacterized protein NECHADRAFT_87802 [Fusarium vanettenii 77-13-4]EEU41758.1 hypothetical protein NECHADRAFT_87802 [Fusarium vanettenii 77-13-4]